MVCSTFFHLNLNVALKSLWSEPQSAVLLSCSKQSPLDCKDIQPVHSKADQSWVFIGRTDAKAETPILWPPHAKSWLIGKDSDAGRDWGQEEKGTTEDEMVGWHHRLDGHEFEWTLGVGDGGLACCDSWGRKESDMTELLNWTECSVVCNYLFIHSPDDGYLSCFQIFAVIALCCFIYIHFFSYISAVNTLKSLYGHIFHFPCKCFRV